MNFQFLLDNDSGIIKVDPYNEISENGWFSSGMNLVDIKPKRYYRFMLKKLNIKN